MKERPILFSGSMVRAIREGRKTQTRRAIKFEWCGSREALMHQATFDPAYKCPYGQPGDRLWVRETFFVDHYLHYPKGRLPKEKPDWFENDLLIYAADGTCCQQFAECECEGNGAVWRPSIHMPRWASRITLEIVSVRVERLNDISASDCIAEGCKGGNGSIPGYAFSATPREHYRHTWESINGPGSWGLNPWVWVVEFKEVKP